MIESLEKNDINKNLLKYESNQQQQKKIRKKFYAYLKITVVEQDFKSNINYRLKVMYNKNNLVPRNIMLFDPVSKGQSNYM